jgi:hypothetical protein
MTHYMRPDIVVHRRSYRTILTLASKQVIGGHDRFGEL